MESLDTTNTGEFLSKEDINVIVFAAIAVILICCIPVLLGKNGPIRSREWFSSAR
jgi:hypothetical protein